MKAIVIDGEFGLDHLKSVDRSEPKPRLGEIVIRTSAVSLNYRDTDMVAGTYPFKFPLPLVPTSWIISTYGPGAERDWTTFFNYIITGEAADQFRLAFAEGRPEHALWHELDRLPADPVISKNRLTPFADPARQLESLLHKRGIDTVLVTGTVTNVCCECTARDAAMRNFKTIMIADANASRNDAEHNATLSIFLQAFGGVIDTDEALRLIAGGTAT